MKEKDEAQAGGSAGEDLLEVVQALLSAHPDGAKALDNDGRLPLHIAVEREAPVEVVQTLLAANPRGIHAVLGHAKYADAVHVLVQQQPWVLELKGGQGRSAMDELNRIFLSTE